MKTALIVNPNAGSGKAGRRWPKYSVPLGEAIGSFHTVKTSGPGEATFQTRKVLQDGFERVIVVGGDGTLNEVVNGFFAGREAINPEASLGIIPMGTGGDFRRTFDHSKKPEEAIKRIAEGNVRTVDLGHVNFVNHGGEPATRYFINIASFGMSGNTMMLVNRDHPVKSLNGSLMFFWAAFISLMTYRNKVVSLSIDQGELMERLSNTVLIANARYSGGGMKFAPNAQIDDGLLDVITMGDFRFRHFVSKIHLLYSGKHLKLPQVTEERGRKITAEADGEILLEIDGETPGKLPATFEIVPAAIRLIC